VRRPANATGAGTDGGAAGPRLAYHRE